MNPFAFVRPGRLARAAAAIFAPLIVAACGSGAVSGPPASGGALAITPDTATMFADLPTTFLVTGGTGTYFITTSNQSVVPPVGLFEGGVFTVVPSQVAVDTPVTLTVRDSGSATPVTAALTVKPRTVSNVVTVTPSASQSAVCGASICAGGDAEVKVTLAQAGVALRNREVRFEVVSGDFRIITSPAGAAETLSFTGSTITDETGAARIRIRALLDAAAQTGLLQIVDVNSGSFTRTGINIAPSSNAPLNAQPSTIEFTGLDDTTCANNVNADVIVFGGRPPYSISQPAGFVVNTPLVTSNGGRFTVSAIGRCSPGTPIAIVDNNGATVTVTVTNSVAANANTPALVVSPIQVALDTCDSQASVAVAGGLGRGTYYVSNTGSVVRGDVSGTASGALVTISRVRSLGTASSPVRIGISDGRSAEEVTITLGPAALTCPP